MLEITNITIFLYLWWILRVKNMFSSVCQEISIYKSERTYLVVKFTLEQTMEDQMGNSGIDLLFL